MPLQSRPDPRLATRDALRGLRLVLMRGARLSVEKAQTAVPQPFEGVSDKLIEQAARVTDAADSLVQQMLGLEFHEDRFAELGTLHKAVDDTVSSERMRDASNLYFALSISLRAFGLRQLFVSETVCAQIVSAARPDEQAGEDACVWLFRQLTDRNAVSNPPALFQNHTSEERRQIAKVAFAVSLWAFVDRENFDEPELELLEICCDVAASKSPGTDLKPDDDDGLSSAFRSALEIV